MSYPFDQQRGLIIINAELEGPSGSAIVRLALDTGATGTLINAGVLVSLGYDPSLSPDRVQVTTGSGVEFLALIGVARMAALGSEQADFPVLSHTLPPSAVVDGLLGLDFLRGRTITIDFRLGQVRLS